MNGRLIDYGLAGVSAVVAQSLGDNVAVLTVVGLVVGFVIAPVFETTWRRIRGPCQALANELGWAAMRIEELQQENYELRHPAPLDIHVSIVPGLYSEEHSRGFLVPLMTDAGAESYPDRILVLHLEITNKGQQDVSLDCEVHLKLKAASRMRGMTYVIQEGYPSTTYAGLFRHGFVAVAPGKTESAAKAFRVSWLDRSVMCGVENVSPDGHILVLVDRVTGRKSEVGFTLLPDELT